MGEKISFNIWDDFHSDGFVPPGETQETFAYIEGAHPFDEAGEKECMQYLLEHIQSFAGIGQTVCYLRYYNSRDKYPHLEEAYHYSRWEVKLDNLTHKVLDALVEFLQGLPLEFRGHSFEIYSES